MNKLTVLLAICLIPTVAFADLAPAQEEAKTAFEEETADSLASLNEHCGTKIAVTADFENYNADVWASGIQPQALCKLVITTVDYMCRDRPPYKKAIPKTLSTIKCAFTGVKPAQKKDGTNDFTLRNMALAKGVFTLHMHKDMLNVEQNSQATVEKTLNKK